MSQPATTVQPRNTTHAIRLLQVGQSLTIEGRGKSFIEVHPGRHFELTVRHAIIATR